MVRAVVSSTGSSFFLATCAAFRWGNRFERPHAPRRYRSRAWAAAARTTTSASAPRPGTDWSAGVAERPMPFWAVVGRLP